MRYLLSVLALSVVLVALTATARFNLTHRLAPQESGIGGYLHHSPLDILFIGSSHTRQGYDARLLEERTGRAVYLLAYNGLDFVGMLPVLEPILSDSTPPRLCVVDAYALKFGRPHTVQDSRLFFEAPPPLKRALLAEFLAPPIRLDALQDAFSLLVNQGNETVVAWPFYQWMGELSYRGGYTAKTVRGLSEARFQALSVPMEGPGAVDRGQREALERIVALGHQAGVKLLFVDTPLPAPTGAQEVTRHLKSELAAALADLGHTYIDGSEGFPTGDPSLFADGTHLSTAGRTAWSEQVAPLLVREWEALPQSR